MRRLFLLAVHRLASALPFLVVFIALVAVVSYILRRETNIEALGLLPAPSGEAVVICGEQFTLNERRERTDDELRADFETLLALRARCPMR